MVNALRGEDYTKVIDYRLQAYLCFAPPEMNTFTLVQGTVLSGGFHVLRSEYDSTYIDGGAALDDLRYNHQVAFLDLTPATIIIEGAEFDIYSIDPVAWFALLAELETIEDPACNTCYQVPAGCP